MINILKVRDLMRIVMISSALLFSMGGTAFAQVDATGENDTTGPNSENINEWMIHQNERIRIHNDADVDNNYLIEVQTGENEINCNTVVEDVSTGDITGEISIENELNNADIELADLNEGMGDQTFEFSNELTGPCSENINRAEIHADREISINNTADIDNRLNLDANTGRNEIRHNTEVGDVSTGSINFTAETKNAVNQNAGQIDLGGSAGNLEADFSNDTTGPNSVNRNTLQVNNDLDLSVRNDADIDNNTCIDANTGRNDVENNTVVGDISTGDVNISVTTTNTAN